MMDRRKFLRLLRPIVRNAASVFFPPRCPLCDRLLAPGEEIHKRCAARLPVITGDVCFRCGKPVASSRIEYCSDCLRKKHHFDSGRALFLYESDMKKCMYRFKYRNRREYAAWFAKQAMFWQRDFLERTAPEVILPVPMFRNKERGRGYNQAAVFARALSDETGIAYEGKMLRRIRDTRPMKLLNDAERKNNLKNAFQVDKNIVKYKKVLLVDDIYTTGSTIDEIAGQLKAAGVRNIHFLCICIGRGN